MEESKYYEGYSLFTDIEIFELRARNRGIIMANILEDNMKNGLVSDKGCNIVNGYLNNVPDLERAAAVKECENALKFRGFEVGKDN